MLRYLLTLLLVSQVVVGFAQMKSKVRAQTPTILLEISPSANAYKGDLNDSYAKWGSSIYVGIRFNKKKRVNMNIVAGYGSVSGQKLPSPIPESETKANTFFKTSMITAQVNAQINLYKTDFFSVYISQGLGFMRFNPTDADGNDLILQTETREVGESYSNNTVFFPTNLGLIYFFKNGFGAGVKSGIMNPLTDYLDNVSELSTKSGRDNILNVTFSFYAPLEFEHTRKKKKRRR